MYELHLEKPFVSFAKKLETKTRQELHKNLKLLVIDPTHQHLHLKPLHGPLVGFYSFRVKEYRVIIEFLNHKIIRVLEMNRRDRIYR